VLRTYDHEETLAAFSWPVTLDLWRSVWLAALHGLGDDVPQEVLHELHGWDPRVRVDRFLQLNQHEPHELRAALLLVEEDLSPDAARWVHFGLTTSDVTDTALSLATRRATQSLVRLLDELLLTLRSLDVGGVRWYRTHGRKAEVVPTGHTVLWWASVVKAARDQLTQVRYYGKLSGPCGDYKVYPHSAEGEGLDRLGLDRLPSTGQALPRFIYAGPAGRVASVASAIDLIAGEIRHQLYEGAEQLTYKPRLAVGSSSMPHKVNPTRLERLQGLAHEVYQIPPALLANVAHLGDRDVAHSSVERTLLPRLYSRTAFLVSSLTQELGELVFHGEGVDDEPSSFVRLHQRLVQAPGLTRTVAEGLVREDLYNPNTEGEDVHDG